MMRVLYIIGMVYAILAVVLLVGVGGGLCAFYAGAYFGAFLVDTLGAPDWIGVAGMFAGIVAVLTAIVVTAVELVDRIERR